MDSKSKEKTLGKNLKNSNKKVISEDHIVRKRVATEFPKTKNDLYVNNKTNFKVFK